MNVGHFTPFAVDLFVVRCGVTDGGVRGFQCQRRVFCTQVAFHQRHPGGQVGFVGGVHLMQRITLMIEELNAVTHTALVGFAHGEGAGPLVEEQPQIQFAWVEDQTRVAVQMLVEVAPHLLVHRVAVTGDGFGDANLLQLGQQGAGIGLQTTSILTDASMGQFCFADAKQLGQIACVFAWVINFCLLVALVEGIAH
ncbi:hypothetical protein D3C80_677500 [compost metagenome]